ncbi:uncharacterized protein LOC142986078 [Anticarsia gemmatalis]|uniref:uncharacterized protein LOC142986078 n=1 Tax=Anticarsia gemmatalis TaxID=129554 RepID=UPI003F76220E
MVYFSTTLITCLILCTTYSHAQQQNVREVDNNLETSSSTKPLHTPHTVEQTSSRTIRFEDNNPSEPSNVPTDSLWRSPSKRASKINKKIEPLLRRLSKVSKKKTVPAVREIIFLSKISERLFKRIVANEGVEDKRSPSYKKAEIQVKKALKGIDKKNTKLLTAAANMLFGKMSLQKLKIFMVISAGLNIFNG